MMLHCKADEGGKQTCNDSHATPLSCRQRHSALRVEGIRAGAADAAILICVMLQLAVHQRRFQTSMMLMMMMMMMMIMQIADLALHAGGSCQ